MRFNLMEFYQDIKAAFVILLTIFVWIFLYTMLGFYVFRYTFEGASYFTDLPTSYSSMLTALTTANFPDVALPAYQRNYFTMLFWFSFMLFGLYFLLNLLLASVFNKFKQRLETRNIANQEKRNNLVTKVYKKF